MKNCECYFVTEVDGEYKTECELTGKCPLDEKNDLLEDEYETEQMEKGSLPEKT